MTGMRTRLRDGELLVGSWITLGHPAIAEVMCNAGFDWLAVDLEHSVISMAEAGELIRTIDAGGCRPLVRLTSNDANQIKRVMDAGANGVIVPMVNSAAEAERAVASVYYPPRGRRGVGLARAQKYGPGFAAYHEWLAAEGVVIVQIEHIQAVENLEAILAVDGVDAFLVGPYDLSASMGVPGQFDDPDFLAAMKQIRQTARTAGAVSGLHVIEPSPPELAARVAEGYRFVAYSIDFRVLDAGFRAGLEAVGKAAQ